MVPLKDINTQLLSSDLTSNLLADETDREKSCFKRFLAQVFPTGYYTEFKGTMSLAWALVLVRIGQLLFHTVATMFGGHLGKLELDAIALSNTLINIMGNSIVNGFGTCLNTVFSQAYGTGNHKLIGIQLQRGLLLHFLLLMPCFFICLNIKPILLAIGQPVDVVELTSQYLLYFLPGFFFIFMWTALIRFTQSQDVVVPHIIIVFIGHIIHTLLQYLLLYQFKLGIMGSSIALVFTFFMLFVMTLVYTLCSKAYKLCWNGWSLECLLEWGPLALLGIYGALQNSFEWWAFEGSIILAGTLGETELGAQSVTFNIEFFNFGIHSGLSLATFIRVGQYLGAARRDAALTSARVGMTITVANSLIWVAIFLGARNELPKLFTEDMEIRNLASQLMPYIAIHAFLESFVAVGRAVFRGSGRQGTGSALAFVTFYVIALPLGVPLTLLTPLRLSGIWIGFTVGISVAAIVSFVAINFWLDWEQLEKEAVEIGSKENITSDQNIQNEKKSLLRPATSDSGLPSDAYIPRSLIIKRVLTILFFVCLPIFGLVIRLSTQDMTYLENGAPVNFTSHPNFTIEYRMP